LNIKKSFVYYWNVNATFTDIYFYGLNFFKFLPYFYNMSDQEIKNYIVHFLKEKGVLKASLFGSFARGDNTESSDIDLILQLKSDKNLFDLAEIKVDLEEKFNRKVDVLTFNSVNPLIKEVILKDQEVLF